MEHVSYYLILVVSYFVVSLFFLGRLFLQNRSMKKTIIANTAFQRKQKGLHEEDKRVIARFFLLEGLESCIQLEKLRDLEDTKFREMVFQKLSLEVHHFLITKVSLEKECEFDEVPLIFYLDNLKDLLDLIQHSMGKMDKSDRGDVLYPEFIEYYIQNYGHLSAKQLQKEFMAFDALILTGSLSSENSDFYLEKHSALMEDLESYISRVFSHKLFVPEGDWRFDAGLMQRPS